MSKLGKATLNHGLVPVDLKSAKEPLPHQTVMKIFSISIIAQGLPFCRRRVSLTHLENRNIYSNEVLLPPLVKKCFKFHLTFVTKTIGELCSQQKLNVSDSFNNMNESLEGKVTQSTPSPPSFIFDDIRILESYLKWVNIKSMF